MPLQTPMSALGLPQTRRHNVVSTGVTKAAADRQRRVIASATLAALCLCVLMIWRLSMQLPSSEVSSLHAGSLYPTVVPPHVEPWRHTAHTVSVVNEDQASNYVEKQRKASGLHDEKQIVLVLTHFRDSDACAQALVDARATAFSASRVHFCVFEELYLTQETTCVQRFCEWQESDCKQLLRSGQLRAQRRDASGAVGAPVARYLAEGMVQPEFIDAFYLSIDPAVVVFTQMWDLVLLKQWYSVGNDMAILSVAPKSIDVRGLTNSTMLVQCSARIHSKSEDAVVEFNPPEPIPRQGAALFAPVLHTQYSEVFHFGPVRALLDVRSDPHTPLISTGYEYARATRFWTRGYDFYAPNEDVLFGRYRCQEPPLPMSSGSIDDTTDKERERGMNKANRRIRRLLGLSVSAQGDDELEQMEAYALGTQRSMAAWQKFSGIDPRAPYNESTTNQFTRCDAVASGQVHHVPY
ncbi:unnamed protein product [Hyaloperonospora brassicae]|uniref:Hexosyltransferase n=1 Tax=Hyaloperonospora brassicae TaxID=162125 RepID=A0AAV0T1K5_HYABA|nr:unnamed protein product [Hyaloperonospora brassicae]